MPFFANLELHKDAEAAFDGTTRPLVMFSHGRGSNGLYYAWFAEALAARGYIVAALVALGTAGAHRAAGQDPVDATAAGRGQRRGDGASGSSSSSMAAPRSAGLSAGWRSSQTR